MDTQIEIVRHLLPMPIRASSIRSSSVMQEEAFETLDIGDVDSMRKGEGTGDLTNCAWTDDCGCCCSNGFRICCEDKDIDREEGDSEQETDSGMGGGGTDRSVCIVGGGTDIFVCRTFGGGTNRLVCKTAVGGGMDRFAGMTFDGGGMDIFGCRTIGGGTDILGGGGTNRFVWRILDCGPTKFACSTFGGGTDRSVFNTLEDGGGIDRFVCNTLGGGTHKAAR